MHSTTSYNEKFYVDLQRGSSRSAHEVVPLVREMLPIASVCDVGCGLGTWLRAFEESGVIDFLGLDGSSVPLNKLQIPLDKFQRVDLAESFSIPRRFDLVVCLEVAEHLSENRSTRFIEDLIRLGSTILFSAAIPGQGGMTHVNEQWQTYWAAKFEMFGYVLCDALRPLIWYNDKIDYWYRQNAFIYCDPIILATNKTLADAPHKPLLSLVHPNTLCFADILQGIKAGTRRVLGRRPPHFGKRS
jgi:SAM-dependent methyltransferase